MKQFFGVCFVYLLLLGCNKPTELGSCDNLKLGLETDDSEMVETEINRIIGELNTNQLPPAKTVDALVRSLNRQCKMQTSVVCYSCIDTLPSQSEIRVQFFYNGKVVERFIDLFMLDNGDVMFAGMH